MLSTFSEKCVWSLSTTHLLKAFRLQVVYQRIKRLSLAYYLPWVGMQTMPQIRADMQSTPFHMQNCVAVAQGAVGHHRQNFRVKMRSHNVSASFWLNLLTSVTICGYILTKRFFSQRFFIQHARWFLWVSSDNLFICLNNVALLPWWMSLYCRDCCFLL